ncbi:MAG: M23 family metallopeptidase [Propionibacteriales bacterium]|nr:M23 family metallopeptidase [Propionibacteriales bacterium]
MNTLSALLLSLGILLPPPPVTPVPRAATTTAATLVAAPRGLPAVPGPAIARWPLEPIPEVVRRFDPPLQDWNAGHRGVDLLARAGQDVLAALPGRVSFAGALAGRGVVVIDHGGFRTTYEPVAARVRVGQQLVGGAVIGTLQTGRSHCSPRACLHWGLRSGDAYRDPLGLVGAGPVRLLPRPG